MRRRSYRPSFFLPQISLRLELKIRISKFEARNKFQNPKHKKLKTKDLRISVIPPWGRKFEFRNPKLETNLKIQRAESSKRDNSAFRTFSAFRSFGNCFEFRASNFGFSDLASKRVPTLARPRIPSMKSSTKDKIKGRVEQA